MTGRNAANHSLEVGVRRFGGARARRVIDAPGVSVREHAHDWPVLSIYVAGSLENRTENGDRAIHSPWVVLYGAGAAHANRVGREGFEQVEIEFDPDWLKLAGIGNLRTAVHWRGGGLCHAARDLGRLWLACEKSERHLIDATQQFLSAGFAAERRSWASWADMVLDRIREDPDVGTAELASELGLNAHWLTQAYRTAIGEGIRETARRTRVERAASLLRTTGQSAADIAAAAGFCDQSHMIRCFQHVLGLSPREVRAQWRLAALEQS